jgi:renalase
MTDVAVVGAGAAGAAAAYALRDAATITVFEKSTGVCGRAATRHEDGCHYDYGANYFKDEDPDVTDLVTDVLDTEGLVDIAEPVWTFDGAGTISEGRDSDERKWTYREGIDRLAARLFDETAATVELRTRIETIAREGDRWRLADTDGEDLGTFDAVLLTPPAPQTATLVREAEWEASLGQELADAIEQVPYRTTLTAVLHYPFELDRPYYALVNTEGEHDIGWLSREACKPGHVPDGESLLIAQMGPEWSTERYAESTERIADAAADATADLLDDDRLAEPDWVDSQGWRLAQPDDAVDEDVLDQAADHDLFFAGDWVAGEGRVHLALRSGLDAGERMATQLST